MLRGRATPRQHALFARENDFIALSPAADLTSMLVVSRGPSWPNGLEWLRA